MEIMTKYSLGDKIWFMRNNKISCGAITGIQITIRRGLRCLIEYSGAPEDYQQGEQFPVFHSLESTSFETREELIKSL